MPEPRDKIIARQAMLHFAANLLSGREGDPDELAAATLRIAQSWEPWVFEDAPAMRYDANGTQIPPPVHIPFVCAECNNPLTEVAFKGRGGGRGTVWPAEQLAKLGQEKYGKVLCKSHYFGKKA